jgi:hypothetical protein
MTPEQRDFGYLKDTWIKAAESRSDKQQNCYPYVEVQGNIIAELSSRNDWLNKELTAVTDQRDRLAEALERILEYQGRFAEEDPESIATEALQSITSNHFVDTDNMV